ncbi:MAG: tRNA pseudouridine synthase A, partial [Synergistaceae bacterium]
MPRYAAEIGYEGAKFYGWQRQTGFTTVQEAIEQALTKINKNKYVDVAGAGRTDSGVHAKGQVCSFDMDKDWDPFRLRLALNANLPSGAYSVKLVKVDSSFHARFSAVSREYVYFIWQ